MLDGLVTQSADFTIEALQEALSLVDELYSERLKYGAEHLPACQPMHHDGGDNCTFGEASPRLSAADRCEVIQTDKVAREKGQAAGGAKQADRIGVGKCSAQLIHPCEAMRRMRRGG